MPLHLRAELFVFFTGVLSSALAADPPPTVTLADFALPTVNDKLFSEGREPDFYQPTISGDWRSGQYGCVRGGGTDFHEGIDIRCISRDKSGEPLDAVTAVAAGVVAYINDRPGKSNYGRYIVVQHHVGGVEIFSLYAHLSAVEKNIAVGAVVQGRQPLGTLGHSAGTPSIIPPSRAHLHLELGFMINPNFPAWYRKHYTKESNDHGVYNGQNFIGINPAALFWAVRRDQQLTLEQFVRRRPEAFRVLVPAKNFRWLERNRWTLLNHDSRMTPRTIAIPANQVPNPPSPIPAAYEVSFDSFGLPREVIARLDADVSLTDELKRSLAKNIPVLLSVNDAEIDRCRCRNFVKKSKRGWQLTDPGLKWIELMMY